MYTFHFKKTLTKSSHDKSFKYQIPKYKYFVLMSLVLPCMSKFYWILVWNLWKHSMCNQHMHATSYKKSSNILWIFLHVSIESFQYKSAFIVKGTKATMIQEFCLNFINMFTHLMCIQIYNSCLRNSFYSFK